MNTLRKYHRPGTQLHSIATILEDRPNEWISASNINTMYALRWILKQLLDKGLSTDIVELTTLNITDLDISLPGDVQRQLRSFHDAHGHHGVEQKFIGPSPYYKYDPSIIHSIDDAETRFMGGNDIQEVRDRTNSVCECCGIPTDDDIPRIKACGDHWRSWSRYRHVPNISSVGNCVLLCQTCNIIKSNRSGIHLVRKNKCSLEKWQEIEDRITANGFPPSDEESSAIESIRRELNTA